MNINWIKKISKKIWNFIIKNQFKTFLSNLTAIGRLYIPSWWLILLEIATKKDQQKPHLHPLRGIITSLSRAHHILSGVPGNELLFSSNFISTGIMQMSLELREKRSSFFSWKGPRGKVQGHVLGKVWSTKVWVEMARYVFFAWFLGSCWGCPKLALSFFPFLATLVPGICINHSGGQRLNSEAKT